MAASAVAAAAADVGNGNGGRGGEQVEGKGELFSVWGELEPAPGARARESSRSKLTRVLKTTSAWFSIHRTMDRGFSWDDEFFVVLDCHYLVLEGFVQHFQATVLFPLTRDVI